MIFTVIIQLDTNTGTMQTPLEVATASTELAADLTEDGGFSQTLWENMNQYERQGDVCDSNHHKVGEWYAILGGTIKRTPATR